jgi:hypothetical protein
MSFFKDRWARMSPVQQEQYRVLFALVRELRVEVMQREAEQNDVSVIEPRLAAPRSSLDPRL